jgi:two-component system alkaline phosphatase synthesis response regulator PhoP
MSDTRKQVLVVEDEADIRNLVRYNLEQEGLSVIEAADGEQALAAARRQRPHLMILDLMLPNMSGIEVCRVLRSEEKTAKLPVLMLTARATEVDKVLGLEIGADDYVTKPFSPRELMARVKALMRRAYGVETGRPPQVWERGRLRIDIDAYEAFLEGKPLHLSLREFELLRFFVQNPDRAFSRGDILDLVWGSDTHVEPRTVDVHVRRLRLQVERDDANPELILTVRGFGYKFKPEPLDRPLKKTGTRS